MEILKNKHFWMSLVKVSSTNVTIFQDFRKFSNLTPKTTLKIQNVFRNVNFESEKTLSAGMKDCSITIEAIKELFL